MSDSVKLAIVSGFDPKGFNSAKSAMRDASREASNLSGAVNGVDNSAGAQMKNLGDGLKKGGRAAAALSAELGSAEGVSGTAKHAAAMIGALAAGPVALLVVGVSALTAAWLASRSASKETIEQMARQSEQIQKIRFSALVEEYKRVREEMASGLRMTEAYAASLNRLDAARANTAEGRYAAETQTRQSAARSPEERTRIGLQYDIDRAARKTENDVNGSKQAENDVTRKLFAARAEQEENNRALAALKEEYAQNSDRKAVGKQILEVERERRNTASAIKALEADLLTAKEKTLQAADAGAMAENAAADRLTAFERVLAAEQQQAANEGEIAALTADRAALERDHNAALARRSQAESKADAAAAVRVNEWVDAQREKNQASKDSAKEEMKFRENVAKIKDKQDRGIRISRRDQETLDLLAQRKRIMDAAAAAKKPETAMLERLDIQIRQLKEVNDNLKGALATG